MPDARRRKEQMNMPAYNAGEIDEGGKRARGTRAHRTSRAEGRTGKRERRGAREKQRERGRGEGNRRNTGENRTHTGNKKIPHSTGERGILGTDHQNERRKNKKVSKA